MARAPFVGIGQTSPAVVMLPHAEMAVSSLQVREHAKAALLRVAEAVKEWPFCLRQILKGGAELTDPVSAALQSRYAILIVWRLTAPRKDAFAPQLGEISVGLFECWPVLGLIRRELKTGLKRRNTRIRECRYVSRVQPCVGWSVLASKLLMREAE
jgi:hypothetical protein